MLNALRRRLQVGTVVYARVVVANKDMEPELVCTAATGKAEGFGILAGGYMVKCSLSLARQYVSTFDLRWTQGPHWQAGH